MEQSQGQTDFAESSEFPSDPVLKVFGVPSHLYCEFLKVQKIRKYIYPRLKGTGGRKHFNMERNDLYESWILRPDSDQFDAVVFHFFQGEIPIDGLVRIDRAAGRLIIGKRQGGAMSEDRIYVFNDFNPTTGSQLRASVSSFPNLDKTRNILLYYPTVMSDGSSKNRNELRLRIKDSDVDFFQYLLLEAINRQKQPNDVVTSFSSEEADETDSADSGSDQSESASD